VAVLGFGGKAPVGLAQMQPRNAVNYSVQLIFQATGVPQRFPALQVPAGLGVTLQGSNGTGANAQVSFVALYPEQLTSAGRYTINPSISASSDVSFPVDNLCQIWAVGTEGDGILASVRGSSIGYCVSE
jgi:hypothetical protein